MSWLIVGLGNPGKQYENTRHNVGFLFLQYLSKKLNFSFAQEKFHGQFSKAAYNGQEILFLKPLTFMNVSGKSVVAASNFFKIQPEKTIIISDDLDQNFGSVRMRLGGGHGGHNGLRNILECWGSENDKFHRLKIGIGKPEHKTQVTSWVLGAFSEHEEAQLESIFKTCEDRMKQVLFRN
jgi:peptidyl-tRNA hydrolase, PTH1 family